MLMLIFAVRLDWLPASGIRPANASGWNLAEMAPYLVLPTLVLGTGLMASVARYTRSSMLDALDQDYVRTARAKGLRERAVILAHALRNSLLPVITLLGFHLPFLLGGSIAVESIFALPGIGRLALDSVFVRDYPGDPDHQRHDRGPGADRQPARRPRLRSRRSPNPGSPDVLLHPHPRCPPPTDPRHRLRHAGRCRPRVVAPLWRRLLSNHRVALGLIVLLVLYVVALLAPLIAPADPNNQVLLARLQPPSTEHWFGTDSLGRDILSRAIWAARISLAVSLVAMLITIVIGTIFGGVSGFFGGAARQRHDAPHRHLPRLPDLHPADHRRRDLRLERLPADPVSGSHRLALTARPVRAEVLSLNKRDFVEAARVSGAANARIMLVHVLPNVVPSSSSPPPCGSRASSWSKPG